MRALLTFLLLALAPLTAAADERILSFADEVRVAPDASVTVTEDITVRVEGREIRHGILRDFPTRYADRNGRQVNVGFEVLSVQLDGRDETYKLEALSNGTRLRIGRAEANVARGVRHYRLTYRTTRQLGFFAGFDEL